MRNANPYRNFRDTLHWSLCRLCKTNRTGFKKEVIYGRDLTGIDKTVYSDRIVTELLCIGPEREDGSRLTTVVRDEDAFQRWNRNGKPIIGIYIPESAEQDMTLDQLQQYGRTELNKRIASVVEYVITAASMEKAFPNQKVVLGCSLRIKNPEFDPPLYAEARVIRVERSIYDETQKIYHIGEVKTYSEEDIYKTFRQLQKQYNLRVIRSAEKPPGSANKIWIQITPDSSLEIPYIWSTELNDWIKIAPSTAAEIGAETPQGAQDKADEALRLAREDISGVQNALDSLEVGINTTFADGIIEEAEAKAIETYLNTIGTEKVSVDNRYTSIYSDVLLTGTVKSTLAEAKTLFNIAHADLTGSIRMAISDGRTTATEKADVEVKFTAYRTRLATLATAFETAGNAIASAKAAVATEEAKDYTDDQLSSFVPFIEYTNKLAELQSQIDGSVMTWFEFGQPTAQNYPALEWTTEEMRNIHLGDVYYDKDTGFAYRYTIEQGVHTWTDLKDSDVTKALQDAAEAKDTADGKRRVFIAPPIPPYDPGDLWTQGAGGDILRCVKQKIIGQVYAASDWQKAAKYTDDTRAVQAEENAKNHADQRSTEIAAEINQTIQQTRINLETELAAKAGLNYVDGQFNLVDSELNSMLGNINLITGDVSGITSRIDGLQATSSNLQSRVALNEDALLASNGRMTTFETDVNELAGTMSTTITQLSNIEGTITNQQAQIEANATAITLKASQASLDTLTGEVSDIGAELSVQAGKITLKAESSALATVDSKVTGVRNDLATLEVGVSGISSKVTSLATEMSELEIGGRNLATNSSKFTKIDGFGTYTGITSVVLDEGLIKVVVNSSTGRLYLVVPPGLPFKAGDQFTTSVVYKTDSVAPNNLGVGGKFFKPPASGETGTMPTGRVSQTEDLGDGWRKGVVTLTMPVRADVGETIRLYAYFKDSTDTTDVIVFIKSVKIERGNKATDYTPAPEEVDVSINNVQQYASSVNQKADSISTNVSALTQTVSGHTTSISNAQSSITQLSSSVALKAEQTQVNTIAGQITSVNNQLATLKVDVGGISTHVSSLQSELGALEIGGTNRLLDSESLFVSGLEGGYRLEYRSLNVGKSYMDIEDGTDITISFDVEMVVGTANPRMQVYNSNNPGPKYFTSKTIAFTGAVGDTIKGRFSVETKMFDRANPTRADNYLEFYTTYDTGNFFKITKIKVERGNKTTDWSPAPEDVNAAVAAVGSRVSSAESSITQLSNSISLKAAQTQVDTLVGNVSSVSTQLASLEVSVSGISTVVSSKVSQAEIDDSIAIAKSAKDTRDANEEPQFYWSNYKRQTVEEFKRRTVLGVTGTATYGYLTTEVPWSDSSGGAIIQRFSSTDGTFERRSISTTSWSPWIQVETTAGAQAKVNGLKTAEIDPLKTRMTSSESSITQLSNSIALKASQSSMDSLTGRMNSAESALTVQAGQISSKVSTTDFNGNKLVSLINQTATTVDIDASRINLIGAVTVLSDITGQLGNITAGTIDGVTFKSGTGTSRSFTLASGMAEFIEKDSQSGVEVLTRTTLNDNALAITNSISGEVYYAMQLRADSLLFDTQGGIAEYAHDRILLHRGKESEIAMYANTFASSIISTNTLQLSGKGQTLSIEDETLRYNGSPIGFSGSDLLWSGGVFMQASQSIAPSRSLPDCPNGWLLIWGRYVNGSVSNSDWNFTMIPKRYGILNGGSWHILGAANVNDAVPPVAYKYLYATNTTISGHDRNKSGTESGQVLRYVVAY
ncbi:phage tail spike protein [Planococcus halocryophilus]|uniref:phage tail spike protein n=1 Tax=Planococcus halocryophilus TaxID=1215089 RepID=UPI0009E57F0C|nr:phage tail spike protein [Planococcus halocryophilus]